MKIRQKLGEIRELRIKANVTESNSALADWEPEECRCNGRMSNAPLNLGTKDARDGNIVSAKLRNFRR